MSAAVPRPELTLSGKYDGSEPAERWLRQLDYDLEPTRQPDGQIPPQAWISCFILLLIGRAATWAESHIGVQEIVGRATPTDTHVKQLRIWIMEEFPVKFNTVQRFVDSYIQGLRQGQDDPYTRNQALPCVKCGHLGRRDTECLDPWDQQQILQDMMFGKPTQNSPAHSSSQSTENSSSPWC